MKDPAISVHNAFYHAIGSTVTFNGVQYPFNGTNPKAAVGDYYLWGMVVNSRDIGPQDNFMHLVEYEMVSVGAGPLQADQFIIDGIMSQGMSVCRRGQGLTDPTGNFQILSIKPIRENSSETKYGDRVEKARKVVFELRCSEIPE